MSGPVVNYGTPTGPIPAPPDLIEKRRALWRLHVGKRAFWVTPHARERYVERVRPGLGEEEAFRELMRVVEAAGVVRGVPPPGLSSPAPADGGERPREFLWVGDDIVFPVFESGVIPTCIVRGGIRDGARRARREARRRRRERNRASDTTGRPRTHNAPDDLSGAP